MTNDTLSYVRKYFEVDMSETTAEIIGNDTEGGDWRWKFSREHGMLRGGEEGMNVSAKMVHSICTLP